MTDLFVLWNNSVDCIVLHVPSIFSFSFFMMILFICVVSYRIPWPNAWICHEYFMHGRKMSKISWDNLFENTCSMKNKQHWIVWRMRNKKKSLQLIEEECLLTRIHIGLLWLRDNWTWLKSLWVFVHRTTRLTCWFVGIFLEFF